MTEYSSNMSGITGTVERKEEAGFKHRVCSEIWYGSAGFHHAQASVYKCLLFLMCIFYTIQNSNKGTKMCIFYTFQKKFAGRSF